MGRVSVREYNGNEDPNLWIAHIKRVMAANNWDEEREITHVMAALTGPIALGLESEGAMWNFGGSQGGLGLAFSWCKLF